MGTLPGSEPSSPGSPTFSPAPHSPKPTRGALSEVQLSLLRQIFNLVDRNNDGRLTKRELLLALKRHPPVRGLFDLAPCDLAAVQDDFEDQGRLGKAERSWADMDVNGDKFLTWDEFAEHFAGNPQQSLRGIAFLKEPKQTPQMQARARFAPTDEWQVVPEGALCPVGLEYKMDLTTGRTLARRC